MLLRIPRGLTAPSDGEELPSIKLSILLLLFWAFTYGTFSIRAELMLGHDIDLLDLRRLVATGAGAWMYWISLRIFERRKAIGRQLLLRITGWAAIAAAGMLSVCVAFDYLTGAAYSQTLSKSTLWVLVWFGYFAAWWLAYVTFELLSRQRAPTEPATEADSSVTEEPLKFLWVQQSSGSIQVLVEEIEWIQAEGNYARVHHSSGSGLLRIPLHVLETNLSNHGFIRVHRSAVCRKDRITAYTSSGGSHFFVLASGAKVRISRRHARELKRSIVG